LKQLWISYNEIEKLDPLKNLINLEVLYIANNMIGKVDELSYLSNLTNLKDVVFRGNPFCLVDGNVAKPIDKDKSEYFPEIKKRIPSVFMIDGELVIN
jgi:dynein light chain 1